MEFRQLKEQEGMMRYVSSFYLFLKQRDAKIIELFFLGLHLWVLVVFALPNNTFKGPIIEFLYTIAPQIIYVIVQTCIVALNLTALLYDKKYIRIASALVNVAIMLIFSTAYAMISNPNMGVYFLLGLLAAFVSWKVQIRQ